MSVKVGLIGCGSIVDFHLRGYDVADAEIVHVADPDEKRAKARAE